MTKNNAISFGGKLFIVGECQISASTFEVLSVSHLDMASVGDVLLIVNIFRVEVERRYRCNCEGKNVKRVCNILLKHTWHIENNIFLWALMSTMSGLFYLKMWMSMPRMRSLVMSVSVTLYMYNVSVPSVMFVFPSWTIPYCSCCMSIVKSLAMRLHCT